MSLRVPVYRDLVCNGPMSADAEEVVQETFLRAKVRVSDYASTRICKRCDANRGQSDVGAAVGISGPRRPTPTGRSLMAPWRWPGPASILQRALKSAALMAAGRRPAAQGSKLSAGDITHEFHVSPPPVPANCRGRRSLSHQAGSRRSSRSVERRAVRARSFRHHRNRYARLRPA